MAWVFAWLGRSTLEFDHVIEIEDHGDVNLGPHRYDFYSELHLTIKKYVAYIGFVGKAEIKDKHGGQCFLRVVLSFNVKNRI